ncbi:MAG TPA: DUF6600 domain-containing protein [Rhizomicrobium sp.]
MRRILHASLLTGTVLAGTLVIAGGPTLAQDEMYATDEADSAIGLDAFSNQLAPYGYWLYSDRWGLVWQPADVSYDFHPYFSDGHWVYTDDYGWYWQSDRPWGDITFHYGRWVDDPDDGWLWIPGYVWSPGWVVWRSNGRYIGWMPMPPDEAFLEGRGDLGPGVSFRFGVGDVAGLYGYSRWYPNYNETLFARNWVFVGAGQITAPNYRVVALRNPAQIINVIHQTRNVTNYAVINNHVVNRSIDVKIVERAAGHPVPVVRAATVIRNPRLVTTVAVGQRVQLRVRASAPHGTGVANSAPPPPQRIVAKLSTRVPAARGHGPTHLFTRTTVAAPEAQTRFRGTPARGAAPGEAPNGAMGTGTQRPREGQPGGMTGPNGERPREAQPNGMMGPNGGRSRENQPNGTMGPNGERPREAQPNGMTGPNGERPREAQPNGMTGPNGERPREAQPNGMTGPNGERSREAQPNGMMGPNGERSREAQPNGTMGPNGERPREAQPNGTMGPNGERPREAQPNGMMGPNGERPREAQPNGMQRENQPGGMAGPNGGMGPNGGPGPNAARQRPGEQGQQTPPPHRQKKEQPNPPQNPPQ